MPKTKSEAKKTNIIIAGTSASVHLEQSPTDQRLAKNPTELVDKHVGSFISNLIGYFGGDAIAYKRKINLIGLEAQFQEAIRRRGTEQLIDASPSIAEPVLEAAASEDREEMRKLWAGLLASARDPKRVKYAKVGFIDVLKNIDPIDALILQTVHDTLQSDKGWESVPRYNGRRMNRYVYLAERTNTEPDEAAAAIFVLGSCDLLEDDEKNNEIQMTATGRLFLRAVT